LNCCIPEENPKNSITGRNIRSHTTFFAKPLENSIKLKWKGGNQGIQITPFGPEKVNFFATTVRVLVNTLLIYLRKHQFS
jgi:hypothetical protein